MIPGGSNSLRGDDEAKTGCTSDDFTAEELANRTKLIKDSFSTESLNTSAAFGEMCSNMLIRAGFMQQINS
jgi:hypothetical protein